MPTYRIISQMDTDAPVRESRGVRHDLTRGTVEQPLVTIATADNLPSVVRAIHTDPNRVGDHEPRRIVSVEEIGPSFSYTDDEIEHALFGTDPVLGEPLIDPDLIDDDTEPLYEHYDFVDLVQQTAYALRESGLVPGLDMSVLNNEPDSSYAMVEVHDEARMIYISRGQEVTHLTDNREAVGRAGILAIARQLIAVANDLN